LETSASKDRDMINAAAQTDLRDFAAIKWPLLNHKGRLRELTRLLTRWTARRVRAVYNHESGVALRAEERADIAELTGEADAVRRSQEEYRALEARIAALEAYFRAGDTEHGGPHMDALRELSAGPSRVPETGRR